MMNLRKEAINYDDVRNFFRSDTDEDKTDEIIYGIRKVLHMSSYRLSFTAIMYIAYLIFLMRISDSKDISYTREKFDREHENLSEIINDISNEKLAEVADAIAYRYPAEDFLKVATMDYPDDREQTPESIARIAASVLDIKEYGNVLDIGCGTGTFANTLHKYCKSSICTGIEKDVEKCLYIELRNITGVTGGNFHMPIIKEDAFEFLPNSGLKYDRIFANLPFKKSEEFLTECGRKYANEIKKKLSISGSLTSSDWIYNFLVMDCLAENGRAVSVITNGSANNACDEAFRKYFIENGYIECVINLSEKMFDFPTIGTSIVVLSHGNKGVRIIDAKGLCKEGRRHNFLSDNAMEEILGYAAGRDSEISEYIPKERLEKNSYGLTLNRYKNEGNGLYKTVKFRDVIKRITRGKQLSAGELDELITTRDTNCYYLSTTAIRVFNDFDLDLGKLPKLITVDEKLEKYCAKEGDLVITKAEPYTACIVKDDYIKINELKMLASGNLYIITLDETKMLPTYVKAYFESENGREALERISTGSTVKSMGVEGLKNLEIPLIPMDEQEEFVQAYEDDLRQIKIDAKLLDISKKDLRGLFDLKFYNKSGEQ